MLLLERSRVRLPYYLLVIGLLHFVMKEAIVRAGEVEHTIVMVMTVGLGM